MMYYENTDFVNHFRSTIDRSKIEQGDYPQRFISVCIICMNRLEDLKQTLIQNLEDSKSYDNAEFILLDYNSSDGLGDWVGHNLNSYIEDQRLIYYRTDQPQYYLPCHSKNAVALLAQGEIIVNVDADNFFHQGFLEELNRCFKPNSKVIAVSSDFLNVPNRLLLKGRVALYKSDFLELGGYDEDLDAGWGSDDAHLVFRAILADFKIARFDKRFVEDRIITNDAKRVCNMASQDLDALGKINAKLASQKLACRQIIANQHRDWGNIVVKRNDLIMLLPSRQYLKQTILPELQKHQPLLDVGIRSYNKYHRELFADYVSVDIDEKRAMLAADVTSPEFCTIARSKYQEYGCVLFNGMIGYGINNQNQLDLCLSNFCDLLRNDGIIVVGWNNNLINRGTLFGCLSKHFKFISIQEIPDLVSHNYTIWQKVS